MTGAAAPPGGTARAPAAPPAGPPAGQPAGPSARRRIRWTAVLGLLTAAGFPGALAGHVPSRHWLVDLPASFPVQSGAALLLGALALGLGRRFWLGGIWLAGALAAAVTILPPWVAGARPPQPVRAGEPLAVLALNLARGNEAAAAAALATIARHDPDVLFLSEVTPQWFARLSPGLAAYPHREVRVDAGYFGVAVFSRLPLTAEVVPLGFDWAPAIRAVVASDAGPVGLLGVHLPRPGRGTRCAERDAALAAIPGALTGLPDRRVVLGDFNATPWNRGFRELLAVTGLHDASGTAFRPTWPTGLPWPLRVPIDHVLTSDAVGVERVDVGASFGSDHAPLFAMLRP